MGTASSRYEEFCHPHVVEIQYGKAQGYLKEVYEPMWDDLHNALNCKIRAIWIADSSHQGHSGVLNEDLQGDDRE